MGLQFEGLKDRESKKCEFYVECRWAIEGLAQTKRMFRL